jgi:hypothetical protein
LGHDLSWLIRATKEPLTRIFESHFSRVFQLFSRFSPDFVGNRQKTQPAFRPLTWGEINHATAVRNSAAAYGSKISNCKAAQGAGIGLMPFDVIPTKVGIQ